MDEARKEFGWIDGTTIVDAGYKSADDHIRNWKPVPLQADPDWSSLMTDLYRSLTRAEDQLRLIHMNPDHIHSAKGHLIVSRAILKQLEDWCDG